MARSDVSFGDYGLKALEPCWLTDRQIEAARVAMTRFIKRGGKIWVRVFPDKPVTKKPQETRMGKGKGAPEGWVAVVKPGRILFEMEGVTEVEARRAMELAVGQAADQDEVRDAVRRGEGVMKAVELREMDVDELRAKVQELDDQLFRMRIQKSMGQLEAPGKIRGRAPGPGAGARPFSGRRRSNHGVESRTPGRGRQRPRCRRASSCRSSAACSTRSTARPRSGPSKFLAHNEDDDAKVGDEWRLPRPGR